MILHEHFIDTIVIKVIRRDTNFTAASVVIRYRPNTLAFAVIHIDSGIACVNNPFYIQIIGTILRS
ncbi:Uncharacterised protein [Vibrio cholerae]|uniref:Uncharacterized protein n=1 Tax=Vibrio cholerae TaxID=666 RepID=A0A655ZJX3_VIBCL|nr:Uncharacterised protein [Vibrio cholerae]